MARNRSAGNRRRWWALLFGVLLAIAIAFWAARRGAPERADIGGPSEATSDEDPSSTAAGSTDPVQQFAVFAANTREAPDDARFEAAQTAEGLRRLAGAMGALGVASPELMVNLRVAAEHVLLNPTSPEVSASVRQVLTSAAAVMPAAQPSNGTTVQQAAENIQPDTPLTEQPAAVRTFFQEAADALAGPAGERSPPETAP